MTGRLTADTDRLFVACHSDVRMRTVAAHTPEKCAELAVEQFDLRYSLRDISEWNEKHRAKDAHEGRRRWRVRLRSSHQEYAAIHEVSEQNGHYDTEADQ